VSGLAATEDDEAKKRCKAEFSVANVSATHRSLDTKTEKVVHQLYEWTIDLGGHPNERGVMTTTIRTDTGFGAVFLTNNPVPIAGALKVAAEVAVRMLKNGRAGPPRTLRDHGGGSRHRRACRRNQHRLQDVRLRQSERELIRR